MSSSIQATEVKWYLDEIGKIDLVDREREAELARRIRAGSTTALKQLVRANLRFVVYVAKNYRGQGLPFSDLIGEGNYGLIKAAQRFDETQGNKFITYAVWWIRQAILKALDEKLREVRLPNNRVQLIHRIERVSERLLQVYSHEPTTEQLANHLEVDQRYVHEAQVDSQQYLALEEPYNESGKRLSDVIPLEGSAPESRLMKRSRSVRVEIMLSGLSAREAEIIRLYFGVGSEYPSTLYDIGKRFDLTRERIRQIKEESLRKLRNQNKNSSASQYLGEEAGAVPTQAVSNLKSIAKRLQMESIKPGEEEEEKAHAKYLRAHYRSDIDSTARDGLSQNSTGHGSSLTEILNEFDRRRSKSELYHTLKSFVK